MAAALSLGDVVFSDFEIPEHFSIGGKQRLAIHSLPGGGRVVDAMGAEDAPIRWSGVFSGQQAADRVRMLERLRRMGGAQILAWDAWRYTVVIQNFEAEISTNWWIPYQLQLCVVQASASDGADWLPAAQPPNLSVGSLTASAMEAAIGLAGVGLASSDIGQAIGAAGNLAQYVTARAYRLFAS